MDFRKIITVQKEKYPLMTPQDFGKLSYQSEFGPRHLGLEYDKAFYWIHKEWDEAVYDSFEEGTEPIGNHLYRCHFWKNADEDAKELYTKLFLLTGQEAKGSVDGLIKRLEMAKEFGAEGMEAWMNDYEKAGYPSVSHSDIYRETYHPHYRLLHEDYVIWFPALLKIFKQIKGKDKAIISIDGNCGSGKTTLATVAAKVFDANVFHMDDFYLPMGRREENWREIPAGNMDLCRFEKEVLEPTSKGDGVSYQPFNCQRGGLEDALWVDFTKVTIVEGSYSQHPDLSGYYGYKLFLTCEKEEQTRRLKAREGDYFSMFESCWIPLEENYHRAFSIREKADECYETGGAK